MTTELRGGTIPAVTLGAPDAPRVVVGVSDDDLTAVRSGEMSMLSAVSRPDGSLLGADPAILMLGGLVDQEEWRDRWQLPGHVRDSAARIREATKRCPWPELLDALRGSTL